MPNLDIYEYYNNEVIYIYNEFLPRGFDHQTDERGFLLPFLAGVLVTTPFVFLNKNQNQPNYPPYPPQYPIYYPMYQQPPMPMPYPYPY